MRDDRNLNNSLFLLSSHTNRKEKKIDRIIIHARKEKDSRDSHFAFSKMMMTTKKKKSFDANKKNVKKGERESRSKWLRFQISEFY